MRILAGLLVLVAWLALAQPKEVRNYHPMEIAVLASDDPANWKHIRGSHLEITGWVTYQVKEGDGDTHIRLCDSPSVKGMDFHRVDFPPVVAGMLGVVAHDSAHRDFLAYLRQLAGQQRDALGDDAVGGVELAITGGAS